MKTSIVQGLSLAFAITAVAWAAPARAGQYLDFSTPVQITNSQTPAAGKWYIDRYAPNGFSSLATAPDSTPNTLIQSISGADHQNTNFYNTQGRSYDLDPQTIGAQIDVYIDPTWKTGTDAAPVRLAGFWGVGRDSASAVSSYPIIEVVGGSSGFSVRTFNVDVGGWNVLAPVSTGWHTLGFNLVGNTIDYTLDGSTIDLFNSVSGTVSIGSVILQGYNFAYTPTESYNIHWDNLRTTTAVPEPSSIAGILIGLGCCGFYASRRSRRAS